MIPFGILSVLLPPSFEQIFNWMVFNCYEIFEKKIKSNNEI